MKHLTIFLLLASSALHAQTWFTNGATWYFNHQEMVMFQAHGYAKYTVEADTIVNGLPSKRLKREIIRYTGDTLPPNYFIVREENSRVFYHANNAFLLMYDLNLNTGDTLPIDLSGSMCDSVSPVIVDSVAYLHVNGDSLKVQYIKWTYYITPQYGGQAQVMAHKIIERVGNDYDGFCTACTNFLFAPHCDFFDQFVWSGLRCYSENNVHYESKVWQTNYPAYPCDTLIDASTDIKKLNEAPFTVFPNPCTDYTEVYLSESFASDYSTFTIFNSQGLEVMRIENVKSGRIEIKKSELGQVGLYIIKIRNKNSTFTSKLIVL